MVSKKYVEQRLERLRVWMQLRGLAPITVSVYLKCARQFIETVGEPLGSIKPKDVEQYMHALAGAGRAPRTRNVHLGAIRCVLRSTLGRDPAAGLPQAKVPRRSPEILSGPEVDQLLTVTTSLKYRAIFMLAYGAGLRVSELGALETTDIDSKRMLIHVRTGKTGPRYVMLSPRALEALRAYWRAFRPPGPLLFPGRGTNQGHLGRETIRKILAKAARQLGSPRRSRRTCCGTASRRTCSSLGRTYVRSSCCSGTRRWSPRPHTFICTVRRARAKWNKTEQRLLCNIIREFM